MDVIIFLVLHKDHKGRILITYELSELNMGLWTPMNPQQLIDILNLKLQKRKWLKCCGDPV